MSEQNNDQRLQELAQEKNGLYDLMKAYGQVELMQPPEAAATDPQLKSFSLHLEEYISDRLQGTVLDIGCGKGVLLKRLSSLPAFAENRNWVYVGVDFPTLHDELLNLALGLRLQRRTDVIATDSFYTSWLEEVDAPRPLLVVVRNVLHELGIEATAQLFYTLQCRLTIDDLLFIQDLLILPHAERGNVCWELSELKEVVSSLGFDAVVLAEPSKSGAQWFTAKLRRQSDFIPLPLATVRNEIGQRRMDQLEKWRRVSEIPLLQGDQRPKKLAIIDLDVQRLALFEQLVDAGLLIPGQRDKTTTATVADAFSLAIRSYDPASLSARFSGLPSLPNFRDRRNSQDCLESFLISDAQLVIIRGGTFCGKSVLVSHVLRRRAHGRTPVILNCTSAQSVWPLLEQYVLGLGCAFSLEALRGVQDCKFDDVLDELQRLIQLVAARTIIVFDHFESLLDPKGYVIDGEVASFFSVLSAHSRSKLVVTTRIDPNLDFLPGDIRMAPRQPYVGRFPTGEYVENVLDDYVDRSLLSISQYPQELLEAIDGYPYLATLTGRLIAKEGACTLDDPEVVQIIRLLLYDELIARVITSSSRPALALAATLRIPTPRSLFHGIVGQEATNQAEETGLLYGVPDRCRNDLIECASPIRNLFGRTRSGETESEDIDQIRRLHVEIARWYSMLSRDSEGDPRWVREAHYHTMTSGDASAVKRFGAFYGSELLWAGRIWFRRFHDYEAAREALQAAEELGFVTYDSRRILASCMIRTGRRPDGEQRYRALIDDYPGLDGPKTSYVDSLLAINEHMEALNVLTSFGLTIHSRNTWIPGQYGRAYMGLHRYRDAVEAFLRQLRRSSKPDASVYVRLAQCYYRLGEGEEAGRVIERGLGAYPTHPALNTLYSANLIASGAPDALQQAENVLERVLGKFPRNAYALLKLIKIYELTGRGKNSMQRLDSIHWLVEPQSLKGAVEVAARVALGQFEEALRKLQDVVVPEEYREALFRRVYLSWIRDEDDEESRREIAQRAIKRNVPGNLHTNVPIVAMQAQLASIAGDEPMVNCCLELVHQVNPNAANRITEGLTCLELWDDVEAAI